LPLVCKIFSRTVAEKVQKECKKSCTVLCTASGRDLNVMEFELLLAGSHYSKSY
jgi:hypothetical protein